MAARGQFGSKFGFVMAATGSAVGLGNIWGFPTQAASNGGAAFLVVYLVLAFCLAYPVLMAEFTIGRHGHANAVTSLGKIAKNEATRKLGWFAGTYGAIVASFILAFYAVVAGWIIAFFLEPIAALTLGESAAAWLSEFGVLRNLLFCSAFIAITVAISGSGVQDGIEKWCSRLMPTLLVLLVMLIVYVLSLPGAAEGLKVYLLPDVSRAMSPSLVVSALGSAFFSLSLGVGTMLVYASYLPDDTNLPKMGGIVALVDVGIAVLAGFLVIPAMYVAMHNGVEIFDASGALISEDTLVFTVLPALFDTMGKAGAVVSLVFFLLMTMAALTSSISMLEVPVALVSERSGIERKRASWLVGGLILLVSITIIFNFEMLFGLVVGMTTRYSQPLLGLILCIFAGWVWQRNSVLEELQKGSPDVENSLFWRIWPGYVRYICPLFILLIFLNLAFG